MACQVKLMQEAGAACYQLDANWSELLGAFKERVAEMQPRSNRVVRCMRLCQ